MIFINTDTFTFIVIILLILVGVYLLFNIYINNKKGKSSLILLGFSYLIIVLSILGPRGEVQNQEIDTSGSNIVFVLDVSKSMRALDFKDGRNYFSRLDASKNLISYFISKHQNNKYGLNIFSGESLEVVPLTLDKDFYNTILSGVDEKNLSKYGTDLIGTIETSIGLFTGEDEKGLIVIITDGGEESYKSDVVKKIKSELKEKGLEILFVGVGSVKGNNIPIGRDVFGNVSYKTFNGERVVTKLEYDKLKDISSNLGTDLIVYDDLLDREDIEKKIHSNSKNLNFRENISESRNLERYFVAVSFLFFILFIIDHYFLGRKK